MICAGYKCNCGKEIVIRMINGRRIPIHVRAK
jgi:hypothetical protein